jgi:hypothetical protein
MYMQTFVFSFTLSIQVMRITCVFFKRIDFLERVRRAEVYQFLTFPARELSQKNQKNDLQSAQPYFPMRLGDSLKLKHAAPSLRYP